MRPRPSTDQNSEYGPVALSTKGPISRMKSPVPRLFHLDDLRPLLAEEPGAERRRDPSSEVEDPEPDVERACHQLRPAQRAAVSPACSAHRGHPAFAPSVGASASVVLLTN